MIFFWRRRSPEPLGRQGESLAAKHLKRAGYRILARNAVFGKYEIDIIAREGDTIAFVEVKTRRSNAFLEPEVNVTRTKQQHIRKAAAAYRHQNPSRTTYYRFDIVSIVMPETGAPQVTIFRNAFQDE
ncbi:MAG TPA: YraN family protein [Candidatus Hydrogenedentes bacterium]|nr:YraN family protein [Candidatus Hydrogenedentota bacterium]